ncbi:MAG: DDE-type integrase/transposase/recombinase [Proteobacteria bacterium]|nr:DDE-type integrase/transposase/recombinase [Pseudomonadota bacterium]
MNSHEKKGLACWARFRFSIIGGLLANPPAKGALRGELERLAQKNYRHPTDHKWVTFSFSTIERWYYKAVNSDDPISALGRKIRHDAGSNRVMSGALIQELKKQYRVYAHWSYQLHADNLKALIMEQPWLGDVPSYSTVLRRMRKYGWTKTRAKTKWKTQGQIKAIERLEQREVRSFESSYIHALWHLDFHSGKRVVDVHGTWHTPKAMCILDDRSRLCCHIQWYLDETAETLIHALSQAFHKRGLPRSLMTDNGSAMIAGEVENGLLKLSIKHDKTLPYSPYQNGKQEAFWGQLEGRLLAMLSNVEPLTLEFLNKSTQAWAEQEYNRCVHEETGQTPLERMMKGPDVSRPSVDSETLRFYFTTVEARTQRASDGTFQLKGVRFEVPSRLRHIKRLCVGYKPWDLSMAYLVDPKTGDNLGSVYPQDKVKNAQRGRRALDDVLALENPERSNVPETESIPPLLRRLLSDYAATGLPPAYLPREEVDDSEINDEDIF